MARPQAQAKLLYYPTQPAALDYILRLVSVRAASGRPTPGTKAAASWKILDPCCGDGAALLRLARAWELLPYGIELDRERAVVASKHIRVVHGSTLSAQVSRESFAVCFLNPPYDANGSGGRLEVDFLARTLPWLQRSALLIQVLPESILEHPEWRRLMRFNTQDVRVWDYPPEVKDDFKQVIVTATRMDSTPRSALNWVPKTYTASRSADVYWRKPTDAARPLTVFEPGRFDPSDPTLLAEVEASYAQPRVTKQVFMAQYDVRPLMPLGTGHRALLLAAGCLDGVQDGEVLLKGTAKKQVVTSTEVDDEDNVTVRETERLITRLSEFNLTTGALEITEIDKDVEAAGAWFLRHSGAIADAVASAFPATWDGRTDNLPWDQYRAPGILPGATEPEILGAQRRAIAASLYGIHNHQSVVISGEMGTGKTTCGAVIGAQLRRTFTRQPKRVVVMCPPTLTEKWVRELRLITGERAEVVSSVAEVQQAFGPEGPAFIVVSKEAAKNGARWRPAGMVRHQVTFVCGECDGRGVVRDDFNEPHKCWVCNGDGTLNPGDKRSTRRTVTKTISCDRCGAFTEMAKDTQRYRCGGCAHPLWTATRLGGFVAPAELPLPPAKPTPAGKGKARWPLAQFISDHYRRQYHLIVDEAHQFAGADTDQSRAATDLVAGADRRVWLTGTLYGGKASSIFYLLYKIDPAFRALYRFDDAQQFVEDHGLLETVYRGSDVSHSRSGYKRGGNKTTRELPGCAPGMIKTLLNYTVFLSLADLGIKLPPLHEELILAPSDAPVVSGCRPLVTALDNAGMDASLRARAFEACIAWPDAPQVSVKLQGKNGSWETPPIRAHLTGKDRLLLDMVGQEIRASRRVMVFFSKVGRFDARDRLRRALTDRGVRAEILDASVKPGDREAWVNEAVERGCQVLLTNGSLVEVGLDLLAFPTIVVYGVYYRTRGLVQMVRRSWRLGQTQPVNVIYLGADDTPQAPAWRYVAAKARAMQRFVGANEEGLAQFDGDADGGIQAVARAILERRAVQPQGAETSAQAKALMLAARQGSLF